MCTKKQGLGKEYGHKDGYSTGRYSEIKEAASMRKQGMGSAARRGGFPLKVHGLRTSDYDSPQNT